MLIGDAFHNFIDGAMIGAALVTSVPLGVSTAIAVAAHEVPQEIGDFAVLLHAGYSRSRALALNIALRRSPASPAPSARCCSSTSSPTCCPYLLAVAASSFLYVALSDLDPRPSQHGPAAQRRSGRSLLVGLGMGTVLLL